MYWSCYLEHQWDWLRHEKKSIHSQWKVRKTFHVIFSYGVNKNFITVLISIQINSRKTDAFHLLRQRGEGHIWLNCAPCTFHTSLVQNYVLLVRNYVHRKWQPEKNLWQDLPSRTLGHQTLLRLFFLGRLIPEWLQGELLIPDNLTSSNLTDWFSQDFIKPEVSQCAETGQQMLQLAFFRLFPHFSWVPKRKLYPQIHRKQL